MEATQPLKELERLPKHIAIIMDGNGRWAEKKGLKRLEGHHAGTENTRTVVRHLNRYQIKYVTLYSFSTENWNRPKEEIKGLLELTEKSLKKDAEELHKANVKFRHIGRMDKLPLKLKMAVKQAIHQTKNNTGMTLTLAFNYGGRTEIIDAARQMAANGIKPEEIDETSFSKYLYTAGMPDVDLVIRTSGEFRISNFLLWQSAYSEYYFDDVLWPDFNEEEVDKALIAYDKRQRRFGRL